MFYFSAKIMVIKFSKIVPKYVMSVTSFLIDKWRNIYDSCHMNFASIQDIFNHRIIMNEIKE